MTFNWTCNADCTWFECEPGDGWRLKITKHPLLWKWEVFNESDNQTNRGFRDYLSGAFGSAQSAYMQHKTPTQ